MRFFWENHLGLYNIANILHTFIIIIIIAIIIAIICRIGPGASAGYNRLGESHSGCPYGLGRGSLMVVFAVQYSTGTTILIYKWGIKKETKNKKTNKNMWHFIRVPHEVPYTLLSRAPLNMSRPLNVEHKK